MQSKSVIDYCNKLILAPMVRGSLLPIRLLALKYGANLVYNEEVIDFSLLQSKRKVNDVLGTIDYVNEENAFVLFRTSPVEKGALVFQIGTSNPIRAVKAAKLVEDDVSAIDINMGCPKKYSTELGIGAALLSNVDQAKKIVQSLVENIQLPITCKIRISDDLEQTIQMVRDFQALGVSAIAVHGRTRSQLRSDPVNEDAIRKVAESVNIPIIANGGSESISNVDDMLKFKENCGASSVMVGRAAQENVSVFRKEGPIPIEDVIVEYLKLSVDYDNPVNITKYTLRTMYRSLAKSGLSQTYRKLENSISLEQICDLWNVGDYCREKQSECRRKGSPSLDFVPCTKNAPTELLKLREQRFSEDNIIYDHMYYNRKYFDLSKSPKDILHVHASKNKIPLPIYQTTRSDRVYYTVVTFEDIKYTSIIWHRERKYAEQAAALVCAFKLGLFDENLLQATGCLLENDRFC